MYSRILVLMMIMIASGCSSIKHAYDGPERATENLALVLGYDERGFAKAEGLYIFGVDGKLFSHFFDYRYAVYLTPGKHLVSIQYWKSNKNWAKQVYGTYQLELEAGKTYKIKKTESSTSIYSPVFEIWVEDPSGKRISVKSKDVIHPEIHGYKKAE